MKNINKNWEELKAEWNKCSLLQKVTAGIILAPLLTVVAAVAIPIIAIDVLLIKIPSAIIKCVAKAVQTGVNEANRNNSPSRGGDFY